MLDRLALGLLRDERRRALYPRLLLGVYALIWLARLAAGTLTKVDFIAFYTAGAFVRDHRTPELYDLDAQLAFQEAQRAGVVSFWVNPPIGAFAFAPLARLPFPVAAIVFMIVGAVAFVAAIAIARRALLPNVPLGRALLLSISYFPAFAWITYAQTSSISLLLHVGCCALLLAGRDFAAGLVLGLFVFKPQLAAAIGLALLVARRWRAALGAATSLGALGALGRILAPEASRAWLFGLGHLMAYVRSSAVVQRSFGFHSIYGAVTLALDPISPRLASAVAAILWLATLAWLVRLWLRVKWDPARPAWRLAWAATIAASTLLSPHLYFYDLTSLVLAFFLLFSVLPRTLDDGPIASASAWVWALGFVSPFFAMVMQEQLGFAVQLGIFAVAALMIRAGSRAIAETRGEPHFV